MRKRRKGTSVPMRGNRIGPYVRKLRLAAGMSEDLFCQRLALRGVRLSVTQLRKLERGERRVLDYEVLALAQVFGVLPSHLFTDER